MEKDVKNGSFYTLACFAPSVDVYHNQEWVKHLVSSVFYTQNLNLKLITII